jgi:predicted HTH domain antitoxin
LRLTIIGLVALERLKFAECLISHPAFETYEFLKQEKAYLPYTEDDLEQDLQAISKVLAKE